ncbi:MAG: hypothetical protein LBH14_02395 [Desulfobulbaceae bacterium]|jgi:cell division protein FtsB|nr:hypothetical protein [Desulfobulbaceae bacterium]
MRRTSSCRHLYQQANKTGQFPLPERQRLYILAAILLIVSLAGMTLVPGIGGLALYRQHQQSQTAQAIIAKLRTDNEQGQKSINVAQENPDFLVEISRGPSFNLVQRDEIILDYSKK